MEIRFQIGSSAKYLSFLRGMFSSFKIAPRAMRRCRTSLIEAVDNAIFHAHGGREDIPIDIGIVIDDGTVTMEVSDKGAGFDIDDIETPKLDDTCGRGLFMIKELMDDVEYKDNVLRMKYYCSRLRSNSNIPRSNI